MSMKAFKHVKWSQPGQSTTSSPGPGDVLIRMKAAGLCHSDLPTLDMVDSQPARLESVRRLAGRGVGTSWGPRERRLRSPRSAAPVRDLKVGEAVVVHHVRHCEYCTDGAENRTTARAYRRNAPSARRGVDGGLAESSPSAGVGWGRDPVLYAPLTDRRRGDGLGPRGADGVVRPGTSTVCSSASAALGNLRGCSFGQVGADHVVLAKRDEAAAAVEQAHVAHGRPRRRCSIIDLVGSASSSLRFAARISRARGAASCSWEWRAPRSLEVGWGLIGTGCASSLLPSLGSTRQDLREVCSLMEVVGLSALEVH
ncbi:GroES-like protein [Biscogniauxia mediterranea]|nr:GroES-like protein [Biscogniauxia mediterranea]